MTREVVTVSPGTTVDAALSEMRSRSIRHLPVVDGARLVGVVTDRDLRLALDPEAIAPRQDGEGGGRAASVQVTEMMSSPPIVASPDLPVESAAALLTEHRIGCLPVVEEEELVGILTRSDLLRAFVDLMVGRPPHARIELLAPDRPGELARVVRAIGIDHGINITGVVVPPAHGDQALVILHVAADDVTDLLDNLRKLGYESGSPALATRPV